jgi:hypothetical protein
MSEDPKKEEPVEQSSQGELTGDDLDQVAGGTRPPKFPDVCKEPGPPGGPVPIPYPNS